MSHSDLTETELMEWNVERQERIAAGCANRIARSGVPRSLILTELDKQTGPAAEAAKRWADGQLDGLLLHGEYGVGKTYLAGAATMAMLARCRVQWAPVASLVARSFGSQEQREWVADVLAGTDALVLDDLDKIKPGPWVVSQLYAAINGRIDAGAPLLITSNTCPADLEAFFGEQFGGALMSRLDGYCEVFEMTGPDRRLHPEPERTTA